MMAIAEDEITTLVAFGLPGTPYSVRMARFYVRAALNYHGLGGYAEAAETVASELVTNAVTHAGGPVVSLGLMRLGDYGVSVVVTDSSPEPPVMRAPGAHSEHWRGLHVVDALSARWGWTPHDHGKAVYAILTREA